MKTTKLPPLSKSALAQLSNYVVLDVETTGFSPRDNAIIEIGCIKIENGTETMHISTLIDPRVPIGRHITALTGITNEMVSGAPFIGDVMPVLCRFIGGYPVLAHNASFDVGFIAAGCARCANRGSARGAIAYLDTVAVARAALPGLPNYKLATLIEHFSLREGEQTHRALDDARCTHRLFELCRKRLGAVE